MRQPIVNAPGVVVALIGLLVAVHGLMTFADVHAFAALALVPARFDDVGQMWPGGRAAIVTQFFTHMFLHGDLTHLLFNCAWLLIFGTIIARRCGAIRFLAYALVCGLGAALVFTFANIGLAQPMIGASGAVSGLMAGALRLMFPALDLGGLVVLETHPRLVRALSLRELVTDRRMVMVTLVLVALNLAMATGFGGLFSDNPIAWEAHLGGYFTGLLMFDLFDRRREQPEPRFGGGNGGPDS